MICQLHDQGIYDRDEQVLAQYMMTDLTNPVPMDAELEFPFLDPLDEKAAKEGKEEGKIVGTAKAVFRVFGFGKPKAVKPPKSKKVAKRKEHGGLYEPDDGLEE